MGHREVFRDRMREALGEYAAHKAEAARLKAEAEQEVLVARETRPGTHAPLEYEVDAALRNRYFYNQAKAARDAARWNAIMWGVAALVEAQES
jgi:hypothetical protein